MPQPVRIAFLGCGFITAVHSRHLRALGADAVRTYASRDRTRADDYCRRFGGERAYGSYDQAIDDPAVDAVVVAVPPAFHLDLTVRALDRGKHVLVEKPAFPRTADYAPAIAARDRARRVVIVGENDHYKPLAVRVRALLADGAIGDMLLAHFVTIARRLKTSADWRNDEAVAGGDAFFEEGIHWLHLANSLGPRITRITGFRPEPLRRRREAAETDRRAKTFMVAFQYDNGAAGALYYSREVPSLFRGLRVSKIFGREGIVTFESNGLFVVVQGKTFPRVSVP
ncbi:MAG TPA: Gfo/Idh/MocA family oxidoreductase, partial [Vicinamibacterales bacterium]|nr:Gfo/Idh/MocA family oxidoreductase [Vicinamibacterales bacterium]